MSDLLHTVHRISRQFDCPWRTCYPRLLKNGFREELSGIGGKSVMTCHAGTTIDTRDGLTNTRFSQQTYSMTLFKVPPARRGPRQAPRNVQCHASEGARGPSVASKSRGLLIPVPFPLLPSLQGFPNNAQLFGVCLSTGWLAIPHIGERRQDVYRPARTRIHRRSHVDVCQQRKAF